MISSGGVTSPFSARTAPFNGNRYPYRHSINPPKSQYDRPTIPPPVFRISTVGRVAASPRCWEIAPYGGGRSKLLQTDRDDKRKKKKGITRYPTIIQSVTYLHRITSVCPVCRYFRRCREGWMDKNIMISVCTKPDWRDGRYVMQGVWNLFAHVWLRGRGEMGSFYCIIGLL